MGKPEWGVKRLCASCGARFYDLNRNPVACPECGAAFDLEALVRGKRSRSGERAAAKAPIADVELVDDDVELDTADDEDDALPDEDDDDDAVIDADVAPEPEDEEDDLAVADDVLLEDEDEDDADDDALGEFGDEDEDDDARR